ncbi:MAG: SOS response-associated peptidase [Gelidibacter sp.]|nr:SOS response-associated peptidase [Gelidibacter sp.]
MCYDLKATQEAQLKRARVKGGSAAVEEILETLIEHTDLPLYHASGFSHPELLIYTDRSPDYPEVATWGLVPSWVQDEEQMKKSWNTTLNARGETIFEKSSFRSSAKNARCLIYVDGFYEHHHYNKDTYPFYIHKKDHEPMIFAGLYSEWQNPESGGKMNTFSIVTTTGNPLLAKIHNNPKLEGPRMPLILPEALVDQWLIDYSDDLDKTTLQKLIQPYPADALESYPVHKIRGKYGIGNKEEASDYYDYPELAKLSY